eukprot:m.83380 g.83380  ORF g.83380 m.83380 type:complete len:440 (-) comp12920_c0_seq4:7885-9204(-)
MKGFRIFAAAQKSLPRKRRAQASDFKILTNALSVVGHPRTYTTGSKEGTEEELDDPGLHQSPLVAKLWAQRRQIQALKGTKFHSVLTDKAPRESRTCLTYPFASSPQLRDKYRNPWGQVRVGRIFEDLDALAGTIAYEHALPGAVRMRIVTANVDEIQLHHRADIQNDMIMTGWVTWVGSSSLEVEMHALEQTSEPNDVQEPWLVARFTFVALREGKAARINPLLPETDVDREVFELGAARAMHRKQKLKDGLIASIKNLGYKSLQNVALEAEAEQLMDAARIYKNLPGLADPNAVLLEQTRLSNHFLCQPQQRNTAGAVFGGFLIRRAFEIAFATSYLFSGGTPNFNKVDEVLFLTPVNVGDLVKFESAIIAVENDCKPNLMHVEVLAFVTKPENRESRLSNVFHFTFAAGGDCSHTLKSVLPSSMEDARRMVQRTSL